jgi:hypothetical protein
LGNSFSKYLYFISFGAIVTWLHYVVLTGSKKWFFYALVATKWLLDYQGNFMITSSNHTIVDAHNEIDATYHLNELEQ